jgi:hypothetical protein
MAELVMARFMSRSYATRKLKGATRETDACARTRGHGCDMEASVIGFAAFVGEPPWIVAKGVVGLRRTGLRVRQPRCCSASSASISSPAKVDRPGHRPARLRLTINANAAASNASAAGIRSGEPRRPATPITQGSVATPTAVAAIW